MSLDELIDYLTRYRAEHPEHAGLRIVTASSGNNLRNDFSQPLEVCTAHPSWGEHAPVLLFPDSDV